MFYVRYTGQYVENWSPVVKTCFSVNFRMYEMHWISEHLVHNYIDNIKYFVSGKHTKCIKFIVTMPFIRYIS